MIRHIRKPIIRNNPYLPPVDVLKPITPIPIDNPIPYKPAPPPKPIPYIPLPIDGDINLPSIDLIDIDKAENRFVKYLNDLLDSIFGEFRKFTLPIIGLVSVATIFVAITIVYIVFKIL